MGEPEDPATDQPVAVGPVDPLKVPRFAGPSTFARLPRRDEVDRCDVAVLGVPFDSGVTYRPGARFGPHAVRNATRLLRRYHPGLDVAPVRRPAGRRRRRHRVQPVRHPGGDRADRVGRRGGALGRVAAVVDRRRPHDRAAAPARHEAPPRSGRAPALRRAPGYVGHVLRRRRTRTGRPSVERGRRGCSSRTTRCTSGSAVRCSRRTTSSTTSGSASRSSARWRWTRPASRMWSRGSVSGWPTRRSTSRSTSTSWIRRTRRGRARPRPVVSPAASCWASCAAWRA